MTRRQQGGFTLIELVIVLTVIGVVMAFLLPNLREPIRNAKIEGGVGQAKGVLASCELARVKPISSTRDANGVFVTHTYRPNYPEWTNAEVLAGMLAPGHRLQTTNPFGLPYLFKMNEHKCLVAFELDEEIEGYMGYETEVASGHTRIIVGTSNRHPGSNPAWVQQQKRSLDGETMR